MKKTIKKTKKRLWTLGSLSLLAIPALATAVVSCGDDDKKNSSVTTKELETTLESINIANASGPNKNAYLYGSYLGSTVAAIINTKQKGKISDADGNDFSYALKDRFTYQTDYETFNNDSEMKSAISTISDHDFGVLENIWTIADTQGLPAEKIDTYTDTQVNALKNNVLKAFSSFQDQKTVDLLIKAIKQNFNDTIANKMMQFQSTTTFRNKASFIYGEFLGTFSAAIVNSKKANEIDTNREVWGSEKLGDSEWYKLFEKGLNNPDSILESDLPMFNANVGSTLNLQDVQKEMTTLKAYATNISDADMTALQELFTASTGANSTGYKSSGTDPVLPAKNITTTLIPRVDKIFNALGSDSKVLTTFCDASEKMNNFNEKAEDIISRLENLINGGTPENSNYIYGEFLGASLAAAVTLSSQNETMPDDLTNLTYNDSENLNVKSPADYLTTLYLWNTNDRFNFLKQDIMGMFSFDNHATNYALLKDLLRLNLQGSTSKHPNVNSNSPETLNNFAAINNIINKLVTDENSWTLFNNIVFDGMSKLQFDSKFAFESIILKKDGNDIYIDDNFSYYYGELTASIMSALFRGYDNEKYGAAYRAAAETYYSDPQGFYGQTSLTFDTLYKSSDLLNAINNPSLVFEKNSTNLFLFENLKSDLSSKTPYLFPVNQFGDFMVDAYSSFRSQDNFGTTHDQTPRALDGTFLNSLQGGAMNNLYTELYGAWEDTEDSVLQILDSVFRVLPDIYNS